MRHIDEDTITQAVIARHADAADARLREVMTSLVQHLHGFARDVKLTETEWKLAIGFLTDVGRASGGQRPEFALLSDTLGLSTLVSALNQRKPKGCTESAVAGLCAAPSAAPVPTAQPGAHTTPQNCYVRGRVLSAGGAPIADAQVHLGTTVAGGDEAAAGAPLRHACTAADGAFVVGTALAQPQAIDHQGPVGRLLQALGRHPWRPACLHFSIQAPQHEGLQTQLFQRGGPYTDSDAVFGVRRSLITDWQLHAPGATPDGGHSSQPFYSLEFDFKLNRATAP